LSRFARGGIRVAEIGLIDDQARGAEKD